VVGSNNKTERLIESIKWKRARRVYRVAQITQQHIGTSDRAIRRSCIAVADITVGYQRIRRITRLLAPIVVIYASGAAALTALSHIHSSDGQASRAAAFGAVTAYVVVLILVARATGGSFIPSRQTRRRRNWRYRTGHDSPRRLLSISLAGTFITCFVFWGAVRTVDQIVYVRLELQQFSEGLLIGASALSAYVFITLGTVYIINAALDSYLMTTRPLLAIMINLLGALRRLSNEATFRRIPTRRATINALNRAGAGLRTSLPRGLGLLTGDQASNDVLGEASFYVRNLVSWVATPRSDTRTLLMSQLRGILIILARGELDYLPRAEVSPPTPSRWRKLGMAARTISVAALPAATLLTLQLLKVQVNSQLRATWAIAAGVWAAVVITSRLDPSYSTQIDSTKRALAIFRPASTDKA
jgi:hypothetical protein